MILIAKSGNVKVKKYSMIMIKKTFYIETMGCQMNKLDSELMVDLLESKGYGQVDNVDDAGVVIFNTCSVREHAEQKVISKVGQLRRRRLGRKDMLLAVVGCMAERLGQQLLDDYKQVDIVCGPGRIHELGDIIKRLTKEEEKENAKDKAEEAVVEKEKCQHTERLVVLNREDELVRLEELDRSRNFGRAKVIGKKQADREDAVKGDVVRGDAIGEEAVRRKFQAFVRVMRGCNNYCSYCIVPYVRGPERSRPLGHIVDEVKRLADNGVLEVTLLGQTVNHYSYGLAEGEAAVASGTAGTLKRQLGLADVLAALNDIDGIKRLRFVTNYPRNFDERILEAMASLDKVCPYLHIPAQSGSDKVLRDMNRKYTAGEYVELIERAREIVPGLAVAGDFIVGFPGESESDFEATMELVRRVHYKNCFVFKYSPRPGTLANRRVADNVSDEVKRRRNIELLALINEIALEDNQSFAGQEVEVLVEGPSKKPHLDSKDLSGTKGVKAEKGIKGVKGEKGGKRVNREGKIDGGGDLVDYDCQMVGRTGGDYIVVFPGRKEWVGQLKNIRIRKVSALTLFGEVSG